MDLTYSIDLSRSWTTSAVDTNSISNPSNLIAIKQPMLWYDTIDQNVHMWAGLPWDTSEWPGSYVFAPNTGGSVSWFPTTAPTSSGKILEGAWADYAYSNDALYSLGGSVQPNGSNCAVQGLVSNEFATNTWNNDTVPDTPDHQFFVHGKLEYVPNFGEAGVLVAFGGNAPSTQNLTTPLNDLADMSSIMVYDIKTQLWYTQKATGKIPPSVERFCAVGAKSHDNSSFEMCVNFPQLTITNHRGRPLTSTQLHIWWLYQHDLRQHPPERQ